MAAKKRDPKRKIVDAEKGFSIRRSNRSKSLEARVKVQLMKSRSELWTTEELANRLDVSPKRIDKAINVLKKSGLNIQDAPDEILGVQRELPAESEDYKIDLRQFEGNRFRFGVTADNHLASKYERLDVLESLFDIWEAQGIKTVLQLGNMIDGDAKFNKFELKAHGIEDQTDYFVEHWPRRKGMKTLFVTGDDHEGWYIQREGVNIGQHLEQEAKRQGRNDLEYIGHMERNLMFENEGGQQVIRMMHAGGGSSYAISYSVQKIVESLQGGEKPRILLVGHFHKFNISEPRSVMTIQPGCTMDQSSFMRKKRLEAHVGGVTLELDFGKDGLFHDITTRWHPFFDRNFYKKAWKYGGLKNDGPEVVKIEPQA